MTTLVHRNCSATSRTAPKAPLIRSIFARAYGLWSSRRALAGLTTAQLEDVGLSAAEAHREAQRPVWDVPANWRD